MDIKVFSELIKSQSREIEHRLVQLEKQRRNLLFLLCRVLHKFLMLTYSHIEYVLHCMRGNTTKVKNIKKYLLAALFNAPSTMNGYYQAEVNHDMPGLVR